MTKLKSGSPFVYDDATDDIVGIRDADGGEKSLMVFHPTAGLQIGGAAPSAEQRAAVRAGMGFQAAVAASKGWVRAELPTEMAWDNENYPVEIYKDVAGRYWCTNDPKAFVDQRIFSDDSTDCVVYYVNVSAGNDANDGLTMLTPKKGIHAAITALNSVSAPSGRVYVAEGTYGLADGWASSTTSVRLTKPCAFIANGNVVTHTGLSLTWSVHSGSTYRATRNQIGFVLEDSTTELTRVADAATCVSTAGSWAEVSGIVYVHRTDDGVATNENTRVILWVNAALFDATSKDLYFEGFEFQGGRYGALDLSDGPTTRNFFRNVAAVRCKAKYAGYPSALAPGFFCDRFSGVAFFKDCEATKNSTDGFNYHANGNAAFYAIEVDCTANGNGRYGGTSNNASTGHENVRAVVVNPTHDTDAGSTVHYIQTSKVSVFGGAIDCGDSSASSACVKVDNTASAFLDGSVLTAFDSGSKALFNNGTGALYKRRLTIAAGVESGTTTLV